MSSTFHDYFRCPEDLGRFAPASERSQDCGFFTFKETTCYGRAAGVVPSVAATTAPSVSAAPTCREGIVGLPFDLSEVVANLRYERYHANERDLTSSALARTAYYNLRPFLPVAVRKHLQRIRLRGWKRIPFPQWSVDISVDRLMRSVLAHVVKSRGQAVPFVWFWPEGAESCAMVTHDVEDVAGRDFCQSLMDLDDEFGIRSSFQVVPEDRYPDALGLAESIRSRGFEVNVHDLNHDGDLFRSRDVFLERAHRINQYMHRFRSRGFRSGSMYRKQEWYDALEIEYDMSVPSVAHLEPQRGGCCSVKPYFVGQVLELPLTTIQDYSLFHILGDYSTRLWSEQVSQITAENGLISFLVHPDYVIEDRARAVYRELLTELARKREAGWLWVAPPSEVNRWWRDRGEMKLEWTEDSWRVHGPSSNRARVAYAVLRDGECVYTLDPPDSVWTPRPLKQDSMSGK